MPSQADQAKPRSFDKAELQRFLERAHAGDESTMPGICAFLDAMPDRSRELGGDLAHEA